MNVSVGTFAKKFTNWAERVSSVARSQNAAADPGRAECKAFGEYQAR
jgi:hypothetical protein